MSSHPSIEPPRPDTPTAPVASASNPLNALPVPEIPVTAAIGGLMLVISLGALEQTIVAVALPMIAGELNGFALMTWLVPAYLMASAVVTPVYGELGDLYGRRAMLTTTIVLFVLASVACTLATSMPTLLFACALQGLGGGGLILVSRATVADVVPLREYGRYQGYVSGMWAMANPVGPVIGGYLAHYLSQRWILWINLLLSIVALLVARHALRHLPVTYQRRPIDVPGAVLFVEDLTALLLMITRVGQGTPLTQPENLDLLAAAVVLLGVFIWQKNRAVEPIIPLSMSWVRTVTICCLALFLCFFQLIATSMLVPLHFQMVVGASPDATTLRLVPLTLSILLGTFIAGKWMTHSGRYKPPMLGGACVVPFTAVSLSLLDPRSVLALTLTIIVPGLSIGVQSPTGLVATQNAVSSQTVGLTTALTTFSRLLDGAVGVAMLTSMLIALLRQVAPEARVTIGGDVLMDFLHTALVSSGAGVQTLQHMDESAFQHLLFFATTVSVISPLLVIRLEEKALRGKVSLVEAVG